MNRNGKLSNIIHRLVSGYVDIEGKDISYLEGFDPLLQEAENEKADVREKRIEIYESLIGLYEKKISDAEEKGKSIAKEKPWDKLVAHVNAVEKDRVTLESHTRTYNDLTGKIELPEHLSLRNYASHLGLKPSTLGSWINDKEKNEILRLKPTLEGRLNVYPTNRIPEIQKRLIIYPSGKPELFEVPVKGKEEFKTGYGMSEDAYQSLRRTKVDGDSILKFSHMRSPVDPDTNKKLSMPLFTSEDEKHLDAGLIKRPELIKQHVLRVFIKDNTIVKSHKVKWGAGTCVTDVDSESYKEVKKIPQKQE